MEEWYSLLQPDNIDAFLYFMKGDAPDDGNINTPRNPSKKRFWLPDTQTSQIQSIITYL
jgi:hypothetical protein